MDVKLIATCMYYIIIKSTFGMEFDFEGSSENSTVNFKSTFNDTESDVFTFTLYKIGKYSWYEVCKYLLQIYLLFLFE